MPLETSCVLPNREPLYIRGKKLSATASTEIGVLKDYEYPENGFVLLGIGVREELISDREH